MPTIFQRLRQANFFGERAASSGCLRLAVQICWRSADFAKKKNGEVGRRACASPKFQMVKFPRPQKIFVKFFSQLQPPGSAIRFRSTNWPRPSSAAKHVSRHSRSAVQGRGSHGLDPVSRSRRSLDRRSFSASCSWQANRPSRPNKSNDCGTARAFWTS